MPAPRKHPADTADREAIGRRLREHRKAAGLTIASVAASVDCTPAHVSNIETGRRRLTDDLAARLASVYRIAVDAITQVAA